MTAEDPVDLVFNKRRGARPRHAPSSQVPWLVATIVGALVFVLLIRSLLERTGATTGASPTAQQQVRDVAAEAEVPTDHAYEDGRSNGGHQAVAQASMVYRCVGRKGDVSLQSEPCAPDQKTTRAIHAPPEPESVRRSPTQPAAQQARANQYAYQRAPADTDRDRRVRQCEIAKREREATLARVDLARTYDLLQRLDNMVYEACKGL